MNRFMKKFAILFTLALAGCFTPTQLRGDVSVNGPTAIITGPATGHWEEQDGHAVAVYYVLGTYCGPRADQDGPPVYDSGGPFILGPGVTLCVIPLSGKTQHILFHAELP